MKTHRTSKDDAQILQDIANIPDDKKESFREVLQLLARCYHDKATVKAVVIFNDTKHREDDEGTHKDTVFSIAAVNMCTEQIFKVITDAAGGFFNGIVSDAPTRDMYN
jgi:ribonucleotide reductase alpha subunit